MTSAEGYELDPEALKQVTKGIHDAIAELKELGFDTSAQLGQGFDKLALSGMESGHAGVSSVFDSFCERWGWGVRLLIHEANEFARRLDLTAGLYHEQEQYVSTTLKVGANALLMGDPTMTEERLKHRTWKQVGEDNAVTQFDDADWDPTSARSLKAFHEVGQAADQTGKDFSTSKWAGDADHNWALRPLRTPPAGQAQADDHDGS
ncbi:hypothetical protein HXP44_26235 [Streptomyces sioyaensis]|uniref:Uncharacterized protein n=1 Tax=Streptomyces sioyaensis TaxID=67364 RepID=A0A4Q1QVA9_9ACTN|nr:hypothetical protein [Streptomyces sioyaensis]MBM4795465.1 hypothetical protein [Streptomyces sioyaensis]RXS65746.1 hypothetical protein EST54_17615 [Streptomyces sioyaensis]